MERKQRDKQQLWESFKHLCREEITAKLKKLDIKTDKKKRVVEQSVFADHLNLKLEARHQEVTTWLFKHGIMFYHFSERYHNFTSPSNYSTLYKETIEADKTASKYHAECKDHVDAEM